MNNSKIEITLSLIKPHAVKEGKQGLIKDAIETSGLKIVGQKMLLLDRKMAELFYQAHRDKVFFDNLCKIMATGPLVAQVLQAPNAVFRYRELMGATNPLEAKEGSLRRRFGVSLDYNAVHGSDSEENAKIEVDLFFTGHEFFPELQ